MLDAATFGFGVGVFTLTVMLLVPSAGLTAAGRRRSRRAARSTRPPGWSSSCPPRRTAAIDEHLDACEGCEGCRNVLAQWRTVIDLAGRLTEADIERADPLTVDRLMSSVHGIRRR